MLTSLFRSSAQVAGVRHVGQMGAVQTRQFSAFHHHNLGKSKTGIPPASELAMYPNKWDQADHPSLFQQDEALSQKHQPTDQLNELVQPCKSPHDLISCNENIQFNNYNEVWEPTFPRTPNLTKGELAAGATVTRTSVWHDPAEPAIVSVGKFAPDNFRAAGLSENMPNPTTANIPIHGTFDDNRLPVGHADRTPFVYFVSAAVWFIHASAARTAVCKAIHFFWINKAEIAAGNVEVNIGRVAVGDQLVVKYRGKPVFIRRRTPEEIARAREGDKQLKVFKDPELDTDRAPNPEWLVVVGVCTHLGCVPTTGGDYNGFLCPCHGSHYDISGRIMAGPAPLNLPVPPYIFRGSDTICLGD